MIISSCTDTGSMFILSVILLITVIIMKVSRLSLPFKDKNESLVLKRWLNNKELFQSVVPKSHISDSQPLVSLASWDLTFFSNTCGDLHSQMHRHTHMHTH